MGKFRQQLRIPRCLGISLAAAFLAAGVSRADQGRVEISQADVPYTITRPGAYLVTEDLYISSGHGITVATNDATIDLNGYSIRGALGTGSGIYQGFGLKNLTVRNGGVSGFVTSGNYGIQANGSHNRIEGIRARGNSSGIMAGSQSEVVRCTAWSNTESSTQGFGIRTGTGSRIVDCVAIANTAQGLCFGIYGDDGSTISGCVSFENRSVTANAYGLYGGEGSTIEDCASAGNQTAASGVYGIYALGGAVVQNSAAYNNSFGGSGTQTGVAIRVGSASVLLQCAAVKNGNGTQYGIQSATDCRVKRVTSFEQSGNFSAGILLDRRSSIEASVAVENDTGLKADGSQITASIAAQNNRHGFDLYADNRVVFNLADNNNRLGSTFNGFNVTGSGNRIDNNLSADAYFGYNTVGYESLMARNAASGNTTNYVLSGSYAETFSGPNTNFTTSAWANFDL